MKKIYVFILLLIGMVVSFLFDQNIFNFLIEFRTGFLDNFFLVITHSLVVAGLAVLVSLVYFWKKWDKLLVLWFSILLSYGLATLLKILVMRPRPDFLGLVAENSYAFPSRHAAVLFAFLPILLNENKQGFWLVFVISVLISYSRIYLGVHYLGDLIGGIILGLWCGYLVIYLEQRYTILGRYFVTKR